MQVLDENLPVVVLAGGLGTRIRGFLKDKPKALAQVCGRPFLDYLLDQLIRFGINDVILSTGHLADQIEAICGTHYRSLRISYSREDEPLGTGGAIRLALCERDYSFALIMNGDSFCDFELTKFIERHRQAAADISLLLSWENDTSRFGRVELSDGGTIKAFAEKASASGPGWINAGIYLISRTLVNTIPVDKTVSLEQEMFPAWLQDRARFFGFENSNRSFIDIGTPESLQEAQHRFNETLAEQL